MSRVVEQQPPIEDLDVRLLLEGVYQKYGYDLRGYAPSAVKRWIHRRLVEERLPSVTGLQEKILRHPAWLDRFMLTVADSGPSFFRDPGFYLTFRQRVVPILRTYPSLTFWVAGCTLTDEVYSLAVLLLEEKLYEKSRIYATDQSEAVIRTARDGIFPADREERYVRNYREAGGRGTLNDYASRLGDQFKFRPFLRKNVVFSTHCLATDGVFNEFNVILCRNVLSSASRPLQERITDLLHRSLVIFGSLGLGANESIALSSYQWCYQDLEARHSLYRKIREN